MMKKNAPYSGARRAQNQQVAGVWDDVKAAVMGKPKPTNSTNSTNSTGSPVSNESRQKANKAGDAVRDYGGTPGAAAATGARKLGRRSADVLREMGE